MRREPAPLPDLVSLARFIMLILRLRPRITHVNTPKAGLLGGIAAYICNVPVRVYTLHGLRADGFRGLKFRLLCALERLACLMAHRVYCVSPSLRERTLELGLAPARKLHVLGAGSSNGLDSSRFSPTPETSARAAELRRQLGIPEGAPVALFVGRLVRDKGAAELAQAWRALREDFPDLRLVLAGRFETYDAVPAEVRVPLEGDPRVVFTGHLGDTAPAYAMATVLALPTFREGFPNVALEAAAMERPVVATRVTGCVDAVVDGVTGTLIPPRDAQALADALARYLRDPDLRRRHGSAGRERVLRDFQPERIWRALHAEYRRLLAAKGLGVNP